MIWGRLKIDEEGVGVKEMAQFHPGLPELLEALGDHSEARSCCNAP